MVSSWKMFLSETLFTARYFLKIYTVRASFRATSELLLEVFE